MIACSGTIEVWGDISCCQTWAASHMRQAKTRNGYQLGSTFRFDVHVDLRHHVGGQLATCQVQAT